MEVTLTDLINKAFDQIKERRNVWVQPNQTILTEAWRKLLT